MICIGFWREDASNFSQSDIELPMMAMFLFASSWLNGESDCLYYASSIFFLITPIRNKNCSHVDHVSHEIHKKWRISNTIFVPTNKSLGLKRNIFCWNNSRMPGSMLILTWVGIIIVKISILTAFTVILCIQAYLDIGYFGRCSNYLPLLFTRIYNNIIMSFISTGWIAHLIIQTSLQCLLHYIQYLHNKL